MKIDISAKIKTLRRGRDMTQDELAGILGVTSQSVSKWETGAAYPDIETIPLIANYFGVTVDELFGMDAIRDTAAEQRRVSEGFAKLRDLSVRSSFDFSTLNEQLDLLAELAREFPRNYAVQQRYAQMLMETKEPDKLREAIRILERAGAETDDMIMKPQAHSIVIQAYNALGEWDTVDALINELPSMFSGREFQQFYAQRDRLLGEKGFAGLDDMSNEDLEKLLGIFKEWRKSFAQLLQLAPTATIAKIIEKLEITDDEYYVNTLLWQVTISAIADYEPNPGGITQSEAQFALQKLAECYATRDKEQALEYFLQYVDLRLESPIIDKRTARMIEVDPDNPRFAQMARATREELMQHIPQAVQDSLGGDARYEEALARYLDNWLVRLNPREYAKGEQFPK